MKLSCLYSNKPKVFRTVTFEPGLNVVLAEIRLPENRTRSTHNLGKTTLLRLLDFCLLLRRHDESFLVQHIDVFHDFVFFLELALGNGKYLTIRRAVDNPSQISLHTHDLPRKDYASMKPDLWQHWELPFVRAKSLVDGILDLQYLLQWGFRKLLGYQLREQGHFGNAVVPPKFMGSHADWKPFVARLLGLDSSAVADLYEKDSEIEISNHKISLHKSELGDVEHDAGKLEGMLLLKRNEVEGKQTLLDRFDFDVADSEHARQLVEEIDGQSNELNKTRYRLQHQVKMIEGSLVKDQLLFSIADATQLFEEAGVHFRGQISADFEQLIRFNREITSERRRYLKKELLDTREELKVLGSELSELSKQRSSFLQYLGDSDSFEKYKSIADELVDIKADLVILQRQRGVIQKLQELQKKLRELATTRQSLVEQIDNDIQKQSASTEDSTLNKVRTYLDDAFYTLLNHHVLLEVSQNRLGYLEFVPDILDVRGRPSGAKAGHSYNKLLCIAFDLSLMRAHLGDQYPRFLVHDGAFEQLDQRPKKNLLELLRTYSSIGIQIIVTTIDTDIPGGANTFFEADEVILRLHDEGEEGKLFRMPEW